MSKDKDFLRKTPETTNLQEKISLMFLSVLFIAGFLILFVFSLLKIPVKRFARYCTHRFLLEID
jgi:hypothetical protein